MTAQARKVTLVPVCDASASGWNAPEDVRIKMCIEMNAEDFRVVHHELGHNYYALLYAKQPSLHRDGAIDAFHEAVGDVIALSATPGYLTQIGLIDHVPSEKADIETLLDTALAKVAFLPFGAVGSSRPWPEALAVLNGESKMDATAILDYFAPLKTWLDEQNRNAKPGWTAR